MLRATSIVALLLLTACDPPPAPTDAGISADVPLLGDAGACGSDVTPEEGVVITQSGAVRGTQRDGVWAYLGIPFAEPPEPWRAPEPRACWEGVRDATEWAPVCPQVMFDAMPGGEPVGTPMGENDCLALNVWAPATAGAPRPVLVFIHGGGNQQGGASQLQGSAYIYEGDLLAGSADAVVVTLQYRLGPFGFLAHPALREDGHAGNYGLMDQIAGLTWVRDNIARFGGDPDRVMVFGESGGALDTCALLASPRAAGLYASAIIESGACMATAGSEAEAASIEAATGLGCDASADRACLEAISVSAWQGILEPPVVGGRVGLSWGPSVDGFVLPDVPEAMIARGEHNHVPFIIGSNADEMAASAPLNVTPDDVRRAFAAFGAFEGELLAIYPPGTTDAEARASYVRALTDAQFTCTARRVASAAAASQTEPVYRYFFDHAPSNAAGRLLGAVHGVELFYVFGTYVRSDYADRATPEDAAVAAAVGARWRSLAATGDPGGTPTWPRWDATETSLVIAPSLSVEANIRRPECETWDAIRGD